MEYERIHKVQTGMLSPSKLRMKLMGSHNQKKRDGSNSNSSRTSPARMEDSEFVKNSLLADENEDFGVEASSSEVLPIKCTANSTLYSNQGDLNSSQSNELVLREDVDAGQFRMQLVSKGDGCNSSSVHPVRTYEDENLDYDSTSSFEFHKGERSLHQSVTRSLSRPIPSKWNDAEKWIMNRQNMQSNISKNNNLQNQVNRAAPASNMGRVAQDSENKAAVKRVDFCQPAPVPGQGNRTNGLIDLCPESKDLTEVDDMSTKSVTEENKGVPTIRSVSMRDTGTEMTPIPSQEPSRSSTPVCATTPLGSPTSSIPSTPRRADPTPTPNENPINQNLSENEKKDLSDQEMKIKTRKEIVDLGVQLGKMNIAAWARDDEKREKGIFGNENVEAEEIEYTKRADAWEEAEKSKHAARFKREEIRIQAWESQQKAKLEAEMRKIEAQIEQINAEAQAKMVKKIAMAKQKSEEKHAAAEAKKNRDAEKTAAQAEYIRQTGRIPLSPFICCGWL